MSTDPSAIQPDFFMPSAFTVGPGGNITSFQSADYIAGGLRGFRLYDGTAALDNPTWLQASEGGLDANSVTAQRFGLLSLLSPNDLAALVPIIGQVVAMASPAGGSDAWWLQCRSFQPSGGNLICAWSFIGGPALAARTDAATAAITAAAYPAAALGPSVTLPNIPGTYVITTAAQAEHNFAGNAFVAIAPQVGAAQVAAELVPVLPQGSRIPITETRGDEGSAGTISLTAGATVGLSYRSPNGPGVACIYRARRISIVPRVLTTTVPAP